MLTSPGPIRSVIFLRANAYKTSPSKCTLAAPDATTLGARPVIAKVHAILVIRIRAASRPSTCARMGGSGGNRRTGGDAGDLAVLVESVRHRDKDAREPTRT